MPERHLAPRLRSLTRVRVLGREVPLASGFRPRLLGLAHLDRDEAGQGLFIPRCSSVHSFGMRFRLDVFFLGRGGEVLAVHRGLSPSRIVCCGRAAAVLELPSQALEIPLS